MLIVYTVPPTPKNDSRKKKCAAFSCFLSVFLAIGAIACLGLSVNFGVREDLSQSYDIYGEAVTLLLFGQSIDARDFDKVDLKLSFADSIQNVTLCPIKCPQDLSVSTQHKAYNDTRYSTRNNRFYAKIGNTPIGFSSSVYLLKGSLWVFSFQNQTVMTENATLSIFNNVNECDNFYHAFPDTDFSKRVFYETFLPPVDTHSFNTTNDATYCAIWVVPDRRDIEFHYQTNLTMKYYDYNHLSGQCIDKHVYQLSSSDRSNHCDSAPTDSEKECTLSLDVIPNRKPVPVSPKRVCLVLNQGLNSASKAHHATIEVTVFRTFSNYQFVFSTSFLGITFVTFCVLLLIAASLMIWTVKRPKADQLGIA